MKLFAVAMLSAAYYAQVNNPLDWSSIYKKHKQSQSKNGNSSTKTETIVRNGVTTVKIVTLNNIIVTRTMPDGSVTVETRNRPKTRTYSPTKLSPSEEPTRKMKEIRQKK